MTDEKRTIEDRVGETDREGEGHVAGAKTLGDVLNWCGARGIKYLTVYAFSTENWKRPKSASPVSVRGQSSRLFYFVMG